MVTIFDISAWFLPHELNQSFHTLANKRSFLLMRCRSLILNKSSIKPVENLDKYYKNLLSSTMDRDSSNG